MATSPAVVVRPAIGLDRHWSVSSTSAAAVGWLLLATVLQLLRSPGVPAWRAVFGEDGGIFLTDSVAHNTIGTIGTPYQGYLQVAPRLVSAAAAALPVDAAAVVLAGIPAAVVAALSLYVFHASAAVFRQRASRAALAVLIVALPVGYDINASATNLHWYLDFACCWVFLTPRRDRMVIAECLVVGLAALSDPLVALALPLAISQLVRPRRGHMLGGAADRAAARRSRVVVGVFAIALAAQAAVVLFRQAPSPFVRLDASQLPEIYGLRVAGSLLVGDRFLPHLVQAVGSAAVAVVAGVAVLALLLATARYGTARYDSARPDSPRRARLLVLGGLSLAWLVVPLVLRGTATLLDTTAPPLPGSRYIVNPLLWLAAALLLAVESSPARGRGRRPSAQTPAFLLGLVLVVGLLSSYRLPAQRSDGPVWSDSLTAARAVCFATGDRPAQQGRSAESPWGRAAGPGDVLIPVAPNAPQPRWSVTMPCVRLH